MRMDTFRNEDFLISIVHQVLLVRTNKKHEMAGTSSTYIEVEHTYIRTILVVRSTGKKSHGEIMNKS
jgi:hypothetical protein